MVGPNFIDEVGESCTKGKVVGTLNANFIALIPKGENPRSFHDSRPITLCNLVYKIFKKVVSNKLNPILSRWMSRE